MRELNTIRMAKIKKIGVALIAEEGAKKLGHSDIACENVKWPSHSGKQVYSFFKNTYVTITTI